ncbi:MAG: DUF4861 family protein [Candidatus Marinimicrobia bacterium]|nr:DUF4861 family protein [Candidatus Neomarinimicrobiota bacterium]
MHLKKSINNPGLFVLPLALLILACQPENSVIQVSNSLDLDRKNEMISISRSQLAGTINTDAKLKILDLETKQEISTQSLDLDQDGEWEELLLSVDLKPLEQRSFLIVNAEPTGVDTLVYGRFVPERKDDFAWENNRIAFRMYGPALEQSGEISSGVDVWTKSVDDLIINKWYARDDYHRDHGQGADFYKVGPTLGCGGLGLWVNDTLYTSKNYVDYRILAEGPLRLVFELDYAAWGSKNNRFTETMRISLDAGHYLNHFEYRFTHEPEPSATLKFVAGLTAHPSRSPEPVILDSSGDYMVLYEAFKGNNGWLGSAIIRDPSSQAIPVIQYDDQFLFGLFQEGQSELSYYAGASWSKSAYMPDKETWIQYVNNFQERMRTPLEVLVLTK